MIIGLTGYARAGKNSTASVLAEFGFSQYAFADSLRTMARAIDPYISFESIQDPDVEKKVTGLFRTAPAARYRDVLAALTYDEAKALPDFRRFLQRLGTEGVREVVGDDAWIQALHRVIDKSGNSVITDVRFHNEADYIHWHEGQLWRITRLNKDGTPFDNGLGTDHPSEKFIAELPADVDIVAATLPELRACILEAMRGVGIG